MHRRLIALPIILMLLSTTAVVMLNGPVGTASAIGNAADTTGVTSNGLRYSIINGDEVQITGYQGTSWVIIPGTIDRLPVTSIGDYAFFGCTYLIHVEMGNDVKSIGSYAFADDRALGSVVMGNDVKSIGSYAFSNCASLDWILIPGSVTTIGNYAFAWDHMLQTIIFQGNAPSSVGKTWVAFCNPIHLFYYQGATGFEGSRFWGILIFVRLPLPIPSAPPTFP